MNINKIRDSKWTLLGLALILMAIGGFFALPYMNAYVYSGRIAIGGVIYGITLALFVRFLEKEVDK